MPPATIADPSPPGTGPQGSVSPACGSPSIARPADDVPRGNPEAPSPSNVEYRDRRRRCRSVPGTGEVCRGQARPAGTVLSDLQSPSSGGDEKVRVPEECRGPREAASRGGGLRPDQVGGWRAGSETARDNQVASARRSSAVMRAPTSRRTPGPAWCIMARQSAMVWTVPTVPRSVS